MREEAIQYKDMKNKNSFFALVYSITLPVVVLNKNMHG